MLFNTKMEINMLTECKKISWGSIIAGLFTVIAVSTLLSLLGTSIGLGMFDPQSSNPFDGVGMAVILWAVLSFVVSLFLGGYVAGRLAANTGAIHGFLVWATTLVIYSLFTAILGLGAIKIAGNIASTAGSAAGNIASATASTVGQGASLTGKMVGNLFSGVDIDVDLNKIDTKNNIQEILQKTGIETLQPDYLQKQLTQSAKDVKNAIKQIALNPNDAENTITNLNKDLKNRMDKITADVDKDSVVDAIEKNSDMSRQEAQKMVDNYLAARENIQLTVKERLDDAQKALEKAKDEYQQFIEKAKEQADLVASEVAKLSLWAFIALLIGLVSSTVGGSLGTRYTLNKA